ncbi:serine/threonine-protein kinase pim-1-like [Clinocottus analis]|uniref:serine/threonine-protein kinase pim-1-like n=1 Tax=Clinocottus analis TaxID=304258 RepID=UPI0035C145B3
MPATTRAAAASCRELEQQRPSSYILRSRVILMAPPPPAKKPREGKTSEEKRRRFSASRDMPPPPSPPPPRFLPPSPPPPRFLPPPPPSTPRPPPPPPTAKHKPSLRGAASKRNDTVQQEGLVLRSHLMKRTDVPPPPSKVRSVRCPPRGTVKADFEAKYQQWYKLGEGGCGSVFAGLRKADNVPVAIKHIEKDKVYCRHRDATGKLVSTEVAAMLRLQVRNQGTVGASAPVALLDWYDLDKELILVHERPVPAKDLRQYTQGKGGPIQEDEAKIILRQLVDAAVDLLNKNIFHRDLKVENLLLQTTKGIQHLRVIDFGMSCFAREGSSYRDFYGTECHAPPEWSSHGKYSAGPTTVWQVGVVLFEMLHNGQHFQTQLYLKKQLGIRRSLSEDCQDFMSVCLTEDPKHRPALKQIRAHPWLR